MSRELKHCMKLVSSYKWVHVNALLSLTYSVGHIKRTVKVLLWFVQFVTGGLSS